MKEKTNEEQLILGQDTSFFEEVFKENLEERVILLNDEINESVIEKVVMNIIKFNREDKDLQISKRKPIKIYINSVGGGVFDGGAVVSAVEASRTPVQTIVLGYACSMGLQIFVSGHERIALGKNSTLLLHDGSLSIGTSNKKAKETIKFYDKMDERAKQLILSRTKMTEEEYDGLYGEEYWFFADEGKEKGFVDKIVGVDVDIDYIL